ncbi:hypothetical protein CAI21_10275 [Alkalilimnicola ehrlichii]|uniref:Outer membrane protein beta-barrel domain-containing protein n=1 Tax=Alkalilimnicola ehrlichii TaxID=351052 RepID=A0A3E0WSW1_9GAMM|nr:hypothetical protein [Alkalilimnicola ehrlichii]RFA29148.1 hypothetical protein CAI21_10275 [Alkalilimnicola ehrlichii]RFA36060.1 hypothetical protein CAL65_11425 [Alkalilimnicola ehrlichii]
MFRTKVVLFLTAVVLLFPATGYSAGYGLGIDVIRLVDKNQDGGMTNVYWQHGLSRDSALILGYSSGDDLTIIDAAYKHYFGAYTNSVFLQLGAGYYDGRNDSDLGLVAAIGYERRLARHLAASGSVRMIADVDEHLIGQRETPVFQPTLGLMLVF